jgi:hypothetical protein
MEGRSWGNVSVENFRRQGFGIRKFNQGQGVGDALTGSISGFQSECLALFGPKERQAHQARQSDAAR